MPWTEKCPETTATRLRNETDDLIGAACKLLVELIFQLLTLNI